MENSPHPDDWAFIKTIGRDDDKKVDMFFDEKNNALIAVQQGWSLREIKEPTDDE